MEERSGAERLLNLAYGNHPKSAALKPKALRVLRALREGAKTVEELGGILELDLSTAAGKKKFYVLVKPLRETGMISVRRTGGKTFYYLSYEGFNQYLREIRKEAEYWLSSQVEK
ncbi:MAG: helix-turn-helix domain-containing protein [Candidatus Hadarchaeales archaeon]